MWYPVRAVCEPFESLAGGGNGSVGVSGFGLDTSGPHFCNTFRVSEKGETTSHPDMWSNKNRPQAKAGSLFKLSKNYRTTPSRSRQTSKEVHPDSLGSKFSS